MERSKWKSVVPEEHSSMVHNIILDKSIKRKLKRLEKFFGIGNISSLFDNESEGELGASPSFKKSISARNPEMKINA